MSKILFLTSSPSGNSPYEESQGEMKISERNGLLSRMRAAWPSEPAKVLAVSSDPSNPTMNEMMTDSFIQMFRASDLAVGEYCLLDGRNSKELDTRLKECDVLMLNGGHVPTENKFFTELGLREKLVDYSGIIIGVSAGTMNSADCVYAQPELPGESTDPDFQRFLPGLNLTKINILPHYEAEKDEILDGRRLYEDITCPDSFGHVFYALEDGSYLYSDGESEIICGKAYMILDGKIKVVCEEGETIATS